MTTKHWITVDGCELKCLRCGTVDWLRVRPGESIARQIEQFLDTHVPCAQQDSIVRINRHFGRTLLRAG